MGRRRNRQNKKQINEKYVVAYPESSFQKDEQKFNDGIKNGSIDFSSFKRLMIHDLCTNSKVLETGYIDNISLDDIKTALHSPHRCWRTLLSISDKLMHISPHYFRLNMFYSNMALFCWWVNLYGVKENANISTIKRNYATLVEKIEEMNIKHEFSKIMAFIPYLDIYCGVIVENKISFFIQNVDFRICKLYEIQDGLYNFKINLAAISQYNIGAYPDYIQKAYEDYKNGKIDNWYEPPADMQICIKLNSQWIYPYPLLIALSRDILDLDTYKKLKLQSARTDNYKAIMVKVPIDETTIDKPLLTPETLGVFAEINRASMNDDIGLIFNPGSEGTAISFKESSNTRNNVQDSVGDIYDSAGVTSQLFNGATNGTAITLSVENSSGFIYRLYRQFERWMNRWIKIRNYNKSNYKFFFSLENINIFNRDQVTNRYKDAVSMGVTCIDKWLACLDITPSRILGSYITHQNIFEFNKNFIPLQTSYNSSVGDSEAGRPTNESKGELLTESGEQTKDSDANMDR